jgi:hypothetical protein
MVGPVETIAARRARCFLMVTPFWLRRFENELNLARIERKRLGKNLADCANECTIRFYDESRIQVRR